MIGQKISTMARLRQTLQHILFGYSPEDLNVLDVRYMTEERIAPGSSSAASLPVAPAPCSFMPTLQNKIGLQNARTSGTAVASPLPLQQIL